MTANLRQTCVGLIMAWTFAGSASCKSARDADNTESGRATREVARTKQTPVTLPFVWLPRVGSSYPDFDVIDHNGIRRKMSSFRGRVLVVELIGMPCGACQAFSGGHRVGAFGGAAVQRDLQAFDESFTRLSGGVHLTDARILFVQVLLYGLDMGVPTANDARKWAKHFGLDRHPNHFVVVPVGDMRTPATRAMIPGFQLVDRDFILREDSTGGGSRLWRHFGPMAKALLAEAR